MTAAPDRILVSHAGTLPRPAELEELFLAGPEARQNVDSSLPAAVKRVVQRQAAIGVDVVNDGELSKRGGFNQYVRDRISGIGERPGKSVQRRVVTARDQREFPGAFAQGIGAFRRAAGTQVADQPLFAVEPLRYVGLASVQADIANLKAAVDRLDVQPYLPAVAPGVIEHWLYDDYYGSDEELLFALADAMHEEYQAIADADFLLQVDDPDLPDAWQAYPDMSVAEYRKYAELRVGAINHALRGIPEEQVRLHVCWGSGHGPHKNDIPLDTIVDLVLKVRAGCYSVEAANPRHEHEWRVWEQVKLPDGKKLMPGVVGHATDVIEHPRLVADRIETFARLVGRENVVAGTDCGIGSRVGHGEIAWAKLEALAEGARIASGELWG